jgi:hypothetical protein
VPKTGGIFSNNWYVAFQIKAPTGQAWKRIKYAYDLLENAGEAWEMLIWNNTAGAAEAGTSVTATGTGNHTVNLATPSQILEFRYYSRAAQTASTTADTNHAIWSAITVQTETDGTITAAVVIADALALATDLNTSTSFLTAPAVDIAPFVTDGHKSYADIITTALGYGGTSGANYYAQVLESDYLIQGANGKPLLQVAAYPAVTSAYEHELSLADKNLVAPFEMDEDYSQIYNYIVVEYTDQVTGKPATVTPGDSATLTDTTSSAAYGRRDYILSIGNATSTSAIAAGVRRAGGDHGDTVVLLHRHLQSLTERLALLESIAPRRIKAGDAEYVYRCPVELIPLQE